jgi:hypothetical protein
MYFSLGLCPIYGSFQGLRELFSIPFPKDRTISRKTFDLLRLAWSNCSSDFTPLQATLNTTTTASPPLVQRSSRREAVRRKTFVSSVLWSCLKSKRARMVPAASGTLAFRVRLFARDRKLSQNPQRFQPLSLCLRSSGHPAHRSRKNVFKRAAILGSASITKKLNCHYWNRQKG